MSDVNATLNLGDLVGTLDVTLIRKDGTHRDYGQISGPQNYRLIGRPVRWWRALWAKLKGENIIPATMGFAAFLAMYGTVENLEGMRQLLTIRGVPELLFTIAAPAGLVVTGGINFVMSAFTGGAAISAFNYHDSGTGTVAATSTDAGLGTQAGPTTRATGTQSNPATNQYRSIGTISYSGNLAITEWGLFSQAAQGGTMWDRRVFSTINVVNGDSLQITYTLTGTAGGS